MEEGSRGLQCGSRSYRACGLIQNSELQGTRVQASDQSLKQLRAARAQTVQPATTPRPGGDLRHA